MQIHVSQQNVRLTSALHAYIAKKLQKLERHMPEVIGAHVAIIHDPLQTNKRAYAVKVHLAVPGRDLHAEEHGHDLYETIDLLMETLEKQALKRKTELTKRNRRVARQAKDTLKTGTTSQ
ncbi:ribosome hibernation-promoting factor, HPF/YfiA family [Candidatus Methylacidithermus pantelleriae]|nr:ribosome-associated translation inhibitor RaiA [Candidatus Methylacidithermus pantelleriae]